VAGLCALSHWLPGSDSISAPQDGRFAGVRATLAESAAGLEPGTLQRSVELSAYLDTELCFSTWYTFPVHANVLQFTIDTRNE
jgi:hypothetical protein